MWSTSKHTQDRRSRIITVTTAGLTAITAGTAALVIGMGIGASQAGASTTATPAAASPSNTCTQPTKITIDSSGNATGDTTYFHIHETRRYVSAPHIDLIDIAPINNSVVYGANGTDSNGTTWTGTKQADGGYGHSTTQGHYITSAVATGCKTAPKPAPSTTAPSSTSGPTTPRYCPYPTTLSNPNTNAANLHFYGVNRPDQGIRAASNSVGAHYKLISLTGTLSDGSSYTGTGNGTVMSYLAPNNTTTTVTTATACSVKISSTNPAPSAHANPAKSNVAPGSNQTITGTGFTPGETVTAVLHSTSHNLGTYTAGKHGRVTITFTIPNNLIPGTHHVTLTGHTSGRVAKAYFTVTTTATSTSVEPSTNPGKLATTGANHLTGLTIGGLLALCGGIGLMLAGRGRGRRDY